MFGICKNGILVVCTQESPLHNRIDPTALRGLTNWTFTYRSDSTVSAQYFPQFLPISANVDPRYHFREDPYYMRTPQPGTSYSTINYAHGKNKKVAWFVSNCGGRNGRGDYAAELGRFVWSLVCLPSAVICGKNQFAVFFF
jgi:glycoprotein 3-alpha-L-fucosyltransferase